MYAAWGGLVFKRKCPFKWQIMNKNLAYFFSYGNYKCYHFRWWTWCWGPNQKSIVQEYCINRFDDK